MGVEVTFHARKRWAQRVWGVNKKDSDMLKFVQKQLEPLEAEILDAYKDSEYVWTGKITNRSGDAHFYLKGDIVFVVSTQDESIVTMYKASIGLPEPIDGKMVQESMRELRKARQGRERFLTRNEKWFSVRQEKIAKIDAEIEALQKRKLLLGQQVAEKERKVTEMDERIQRFARVICNSLELRSDLENSRVVL